MTATVFRINKSFSSNSRITRRSGSANTTRSAQYLECSGAKVQTKGARQETTFVRLLSTKSGRRCAAKASFEPNGVGKVTFNKTERPDGVIAKLKQLGLPAIISYGLLNTLYYVCAFVIAFWSYSAVSSGSAPKPGFKGQFGQALVVLTVVWAGSQVTKVFRASGALILTPTVERLLSYIRRKVGLRSQMQAAILVTLLCFLLAVFVLTSSVLIKSTI